MNDTYTTKLDMQTGTINICGGDTRFQFVIDEVPEIIESLKSEYERAKAIMGNPLLDTRKINSFMSAYRTLDRPAPEFEAMVEFYQNTLVMLSRLETELRETSSLINQCTYHPIPGVVKDNLCTGAAQLNRSYDKLAAILEAHNHNMPE